MKVLCDNIVVEIQKKTDNKTSSGIILQEKKKVSAIQYGEVVAIGVDAKGIDIGDTVAFSAYKGLPFDRDGKDYKCLSSENVMFKVEPEVGVDYNY